MNRLVRGILILSKILFLLKQIKDGNHIYLAVLKIAIFYKTNVWNLSRSSNNFQLFFILLLWNGC